MKTFRLTLILTLLLTAPAAFAGVDVNGDNSVDVSDLNYVINTLMGQTTGYDCDVSGDGFVDVSGLFKLEIGMGVWVSLIGGIACVVLDFLRASRAKSESA